MIYHMSNTLRRWFSPRGQNTIDIEVREREAYWFEHPFDFTCRACWAEPREREAHVGGIVSEGFLGLFGALPVPFHGEFRDWGQLYVQRGRLLFLGDHSTRVLLFDQILQTTWLDNGVQFHYEHGMVTIEGPVRAPICGALSQMGYLPPATYTG